MPDLAPSSTAKWFRLRRFPTWRLWLPMVSVLLGLFLWLGPKVHGWLAVTDRVAQARYVVVEGWAADYVILAAEQEFDDLNAKLLLTTGLPLDRGASLSEIKNFATLSANTLAKSGMKPQSIYPVPAPAVARERTAAMAAALKKALDGLNVPVADRSIQLVTSSTHARRSRKVYQRELGPDWQVGVVSIADPSYPAETWYRHSSGAKGVIDELVALFIVTCGGE
jgi:hypothetical protein